MFVFRKIWRALFSWNTSFKIRSFALLPTNYHPCLRNNFLIQPGSVHSPIPLNLWGIIWPCNLSLLKLMLEILIDFANMYCYTKFVIWLWEIVFWFSLALFPLLSHWLFETLSAHLISPLWSMWLRYCVISTMLYNYVALQY